MLLFLIGRGLDTVLMYFVVRFYITSPENLKELLRWLGYVAAIMGILGAVETITTWSPYASMVAYRTWSWFPIEINSAAGSCAQRATQKYTFILA
jgi:hypothetical protein